MLTDSQYITRPDGSCAPTYNAQTNKYGFAIGIRPRPTRQGLTWSWPGDRPHNTRMHHYTELSPSEKAGWDDVAAHMANQHSEFGVTTYSGIIAYMQTNLYRRILGLPYSDTPPAFVAGVPPREAQFQTDAPRQAPIMISLHP